MTRWFVRRASLPTVSASPPVEFRRRPGESTSRSAKSRSRPGEYGLGPVDSCSPPASPGVSDSRSALGTSGGARSSVLNIVRPIRETTSNAHLSDYGMHRGMLRAVLSRLQASPGPHPRTLDARRRHHIRVRWGTQLVTKNFSSPPEQGVNETRNGWDAISISKPTRKAESRRKSALNRRTGTGRARP